MTIDKSIDTTTNHQPGKEQGYRRNRMKFGIYLHNGNYPNVDLRFPEKGNPGIGGTEFLELALAYYLDLFFSDKIEVVLFANRTELLPDSVQACLATDVIDAAIKSKNEACDIFMFASRHVTDQLCQTLTEKNIKAIARSTNHIEVFQLNMIANCPAIQCHCCDGHEYLDLLRDHKIFKKSALIVDFLNARQFNPTAILPKDGNTVVYIGNIIFVKGFHILARVWPQIIRQRPNAKLIVIGSGKLYNREQRLGKWGIAEEQYEAKYLRPFLADANGQIMESVSFTGLLGAERIEIFQRATVGVINPSGCTEVFPGSALEIQAAGTPVVSAAKWGVLDAVLHGKTGLLGKTDQELIKNILYFLDHPEIASQFGQNGIDFVKRTCDPKVVAQQWIDLLTDCVNDRPLTPLPIKPNYWYDAKFFREGMRLLKSTVPALENLPALVELKPLLKKQLKSITKSPHSLSKLM
jgi:glycosyltransferase involved in cell wall biosynthesis